MGKFNNYKFQLNQFETIVSTNLKSIQTEGDFHDVTIACDSTEMKAHKVIISSNSTIFKDILCKNLHPHPVIYLKGVKDKELSYILDFIYRGEVNVEQTALNGFLSLAEDLKIKGLTEGDREQATTLTLVEQELSSKFNNKENIPEGNAVIEEEFVMVGENEELTNKHIYNTSIKEENNEQYRPKYKNIQNKNIVKEILSDPQNYRKYSLVQDKEDKSATDHQLETKENLSTISQQSFVWKYFDYKKSPEISFVQCLICQKKINNFKGEKVLKYHISQHRIKGEIKNVDEFKKNKYFYENNISSTAKKEKAESDPKFTVHIGENEAKDIADSKCFVDSTLEDAMIKNILTHKSVSADHLKMNQNRLKDYFCEKCDFRTSNWDTFMIHFKDIHIHENIASNELKIKDFKPIRSCDKCEYTAKNNSHLREHIESVHEGIRYPCDLCKHKSATERRLKYHKEWKHEGKGYPCNMCKYHAPNEKILKKHKESKHKGIRYPCDVCNFESKRRKLTENHKRRVHGLSKDKNYVML